MEVVSIIKFEFGYPSTNLNQTCGSNQKRFKTQTDTLPPSASQGNNKKHRGYFNTPPKSARARTQEAWPGEVENPWKEIEILSRFGLGPDQLPGVCRSFGSFRTECGALERFVLFVCLFACFCLEPVCVFLRVNLGGVFFVLFLKVNLRVVCFPPFFPFFYSFCLV